jgi:hypothetical protein
MPIVFMPVFKAAAVKRSTSASQMVFSKARQAR